MKTERDIKHDGVAIGVVSSHVDRLTEKPFFRAYSFRCGMGCGPFDTEEQAETWVRERKPVARYWRGP